MQEIKLKIIGIAQRREHLEMAEAEARAVKMGLRFLTNKEVDALLQDGKTAETYAAYFPCWTATQVRFDGSDCAVTENGKIGKISLPKTDGWYAADEKYGLPIGKESSKKDANARFLSRLDDRGGFVTRGWNHVDSEFIPQDDWRVVALHDFDTHVGALGTPVEDPARERKNEAKKPDGR